MARYVLPFALVALAVGCASLAGLTGGRPDAGGDGPDAAPNVPVVDPCHHALAPPPPAVDDSPHKEISAFVLALQSISMLATNDAGEAVGYDLDGVCTCFPDPTTAFEAGPSCISHGPPACDLPGGVDSQLNTTFGKISGFVTLNKDTDVNRQISLGEESLVFLISRYNGLANDQQVYVNMLLANGIVENKCGDAGVDSGVGTFKPTWSGCDTWSIDQTSILPGTVGGVVPALPPTEGYVTDHVLVVRLTTPLPFGYGGATLHVIAPVLTGRLDPDNGFSLEDGAIAGRVSVVDALQVVGAARAPGKDAGAVCTHADIFSAVKNGYICPNADVMADKQFDNDPTSTCDAISLALAFTAAPAQLGSRSQRDASPIDCDLDGAPADMYDCGH